MSLVDILGKLELFYGLSQNEIEEISSICSESQFTSGDLITIAGKPGDQMYIIMNGFVKVSIGSGPTKRAIVNLGPGQVFGEMSLVDNGPRSATVEAVTDLTIVHIIHRDDFDRICITNNHIGYLVMRNLACDISFKLRQRNLSESG